VHGALRAVMAAAVTLVAAGCGGAVDRRQQFEHSLHLQPEMDMGRIFDYDEADLALADRLRHHGVPGLGIAVISDFEIEWAGAYGVKSAATGDPVTPSTIFEAGSTSKLATATLAMMLVEDGVLSLDRPVNELLHRWRIPDNELTAERPVTLRMLLSHTSGMNRPASMYAFEPGSSPTLLDVLDGRPPAINDPAVIEAVPGSRHAYSNIAYNVIQLLIEDATDRPFEAVMRERVFGPLGMESCTYQFPLSAEIERRVALPHDADGRPAMNDLHPSALAHGGLLCTPRDLAALAVALMQGFHGSADVLLSQATVRSMLAGERQLDDEVGGFNVQALGAFLLSNRGGMYFAHHGYNTPGTCCLLLANPSSGDGVVVMANGANGFQLIFEIVAGLADVYRWPVVKP
jgi:CubicO group peptidase (beta-lactamase class C family)